MKALLAGGGKADERLGVEELSTAFGGVLGSAVSLPITQSVRGEHDALDGAIRFRRSASG